MGIFSVETNIIPAILMYGSLLAVLIMTITGHKDKSRSVTPPPPVYPVYPYPNQPGIPYSPAANVPPPPVPAPTPSTVIYRGSSLVLPDGNKILLTEATRALGRTDFERIVAPGSANVISRQHFMIMSQQGQFYARDNNSANGTRINGIDIKGKDWQLLNDGDRIEVAGVMTLTYKNG
jgi:hypothetical protein